MRAAQAAFKLAPGLDFAARRAWATCLGSSEVAAVGAFQHLGSSGSSGSTSSSSGGSRAWCSAAPASSRAGKAAGGKKASSSKAALKPGEPRPSRSRSRSRSQGHSGSTPNSGAWPDPAPVQRHRMQAPPRDGFALLHALNCAGSHKAVLHLLISHRPLVGAAHLLRALLRMGELQRVQGGAVHGADQEAFAGALDLALDQLRLEGLQLTFAEACQLLESAAWMEQALSGGQQAAVEAAVLHSVHSGTARRIEQLLACYLRLGMQPSATLAAALAPPICLEEEVEAEEAAAAADATGVAGTAEAADATGAAGTAEAAAAAADAAGAGAAGSAAAPRQAAAPAFEPLRPQALTIEISKADGIQRLLRLLVLHSPQLNATHLQAALASLAAHVTTDPELLNPALQHVFRVLRQRALAALAQQPTDFSLGAVYVVLHSSAAMRVPLAPRQQAAVEAAAERTLPGDAAAQLCNVLKACEALSMRPGPGMASALLEAAEWKLAAATPEQLSELVPAWERCGLRTTSALMRGAEDAALRALCTQRDAADASAVQQLLEAYTASGWQCSVALAAELRAAVLRCLPGAGAAFASAALSSCRKLGFLPDAELAAAFLQAAPAVLQEDSQPAFAYVPRLLMVLQLQGWQYSSAPAEEQQLMQPLLEKQRRQVAVLTRVPPKTDEALSGGLGIVTHALHLLASVGLRPSDADLQAACAFLQRHEHRLSHKQLMWLQGAFQEWQFVRHGLHSGKAHRVLGSIRMGGGGADGTAAEAGLAAADAQ